MAELDTEEREKLDKRKFAYVDRAGEGHLPIHDEAHVRNALARWNQTAFESEAAKKAARRKVLAAAKRYGIDVSKDANVAKPVKGLRAASTKARSQGQGPLMGQGPHGGRRRIARRGSKPTKRTSSRHRR